MGEKQAMASGAMAALSDCDRDGGTCQSSVEDGQRVEREPSCVKWQIVNREAPGNRNGIEG